MVKIISRFFAFCGEENRKRFYHSIILGVLQAIFEALKIPAIACMAKRLRSLPLPAWCARCFAEA